MISLGIDPGTATTGYGVVAEKEGVLTCLKYGVVETDKSLSPSRRLNDLSTKIDALIREFSPDLLAIENVYFFKNSKTAIPVSQAKGAVMLTAEKTGTSVCEFTPLEIKMSITGYGRADKKQVQEMIKIMLNLKEKPAPSDAADALGAAICGIIKEKSPLSAE